MENVLNIQMVNINGLEMTRDAVNDLMKQDEKFFLRVVDQASTEEGTREYLHEIRKLDRVEARLNHNHHPLNSLWNSFYGETTGKYLCFLNNDVRLPTNFVRDTVSIFEKEPDVGIVIHATNFLEKSDELLYEIIEGGWVQGWDHSIRREAYIPVPEELHTYGGDDWLFCNAYDNGWKVAVALSSPIIHYGKRSRHSMYGGRRHKKHDEYHARQLGVLRNHRYGSPWARGYK